MKDGKGFAQKTERACMCVCESFLSNFTLNFVLIHLSYYLVNLNFFPIEFIIHRNVVAAWMTLQHF